MPMSRTALVVTVLLAASVSLAACGGGTQEATKSSASSARRGTTTSTITTSTTSTTVPASTTTTSGPATTVAGPTPQEVTDATWATSAADHRGQNGVRLAFTCAPGGTLGSVWGSGPYTDDSSVCSAAVHGGYLNVTDGGRVVVEIRPGEPTYQGTQANGVTSSDYGSWSGSFVIVG